MKRLILTLLSLLIVSYSLFAQAPGGVSANLRWWLKANAGTFTDNGTTAATNGQAVQQWNDQSSVGNHARNTVLANKPIYRTNIINGNPALQFSSDQFLDGLAAPGITNTESFYMIMVFRQNSYVAAGNDANGTFIIDRPSATNPLMSFKMVNTDKYFYQKRNDAGGSLGGPVSVSSAPTNIFQVVDYFRNTGVRYGIYINGRLDATAGGDSDNITSPNIRIGRHATNSGGGLNGDFAEAIVYDANLTTGNRIRIESYLAIKYGITLDQTNPTNYFNSSGGIIYPSATSHDAYDYDIAGIGRDDGSALNQTGSQSQNAVSIVRIFNPSPALDDGDFLVWGHNAPTIWNSAEVPSPYINRLTRTWRVAETGETGTFSVSFDLTGLGVDMSDPTRFAFLVDTDGNFSDATAHTTGRSIVGNVVTFTGASINTNEYFSLACPLIPGPGGVAATTVWLRADEDVYVNAGTTLATNNQTVQQWNTRGGLTAANATQATAGNRPTYLTNTMNGNPVLRFGSTQFLDLGNLGISSSSDLNMSVVFRPNTLNGGTLTNTTGGYIIDRTTATTPVFSLKLLSSTKGALQERIDSNPPFDGPITTSNVSTNVPQIIDYYRDYAVGFGIQYNGALENTLAEAGGALTFPNPRIGARESGTNGLNGDISEFIMYNRDISSGERNRIDSYLAIKYGITLDQVTLTNYTASTGVVVYPATTTHSVYNKDIAGIARDAASRLNQSNSQSVNMNSVVRMQSPSSLDDMDYLMWGSNGNSFTVRNTVDVGAPILGRMTRVWRIAETGEAGTVTVSFDLSMYPNKTQATLRLLIDRDGDGFADNDVAPLSGTLAGNIFTVTGVNFQNNDFFTIGSTNLAVTPLPVELTSFTGSYENPVVALNWKTASELNNNYFTLERSASGVQFEEVAKIPGSGTTSEAHQYAYVDPSPFPKETYYRLKQTDFDSNFEYSKIIRVETGKEPKRKLSIYPNPSDGNIIHFTYGDTPFQLNQIEIISQQNVTLVSHTQEATSGTDFSYQLSRPLPPGMYIVRVKFNNKLESIKLVVK
jgi:hypothetical protein